MGRQDWAAAVGLGEKAAGADELDPQAAADAAKAYGLWWAQDAMGDRLASPRKHQAARDHLEKAYGWAGQAVGRDRQDASWEQLVSVIAWTAGKRDESIKRLDQAAKMDPQNLRLRLQYAQLLLAAHDRAAAMRELDAALAIDHGLLPDSSERLSAGELRMIEELRKKRTAD